VQDLDAPDKIKNTLFTLSCSCIREIRASMLKTNQVTGNAPAFPAYSPSMAITTVFLISPCTSISYTSFSRSIDFSMLSMHGNQLSHSGLIL
jgi:hypothetical protein